MAKRLTEKQKLARLMRKPLEQLTAAERRLTGRWDIQHGCTPEEMDAYFAKPALDAEGRRTLGGWYPEGKVRWSKQRRFPLQKVPPERRAIAERKFHEIMERKKARGIVITYHHIGSAWGNAVTYANHHVTGNSRRWTRCHRMRKRRHKGVLNKRARAAQKAEVVEFKEKPLKKRVKWGMT